MPGFKTDEFIQADLNPRVEAIKVPDLQSWFEEGQEPVWNVRGLNGCEVAQYTEAVAKNRNLSAIAEGLVSGDKTDVIEGMRELLGIGEAVPDETAKRIAVLELGSVDPVVDNQIAVKLNDAFPVIFFQITNRILSLTGEGATLGKPKDSGECQKSECA